MEKCPERHHNLHQILNHIKLQEVKGFFVVCDLKIYNVMLGLSAHGGKYSCSFCLGPASIYSGVHRTFGHLQDHYISYQKADRNPELMLQHYNTINNCLIAGSREERVLDKVILPELYMTIGNVNHLLHPIQELWVGLV